MTVTPQTVSDANQSNSSAKSVTSEVVSEDEAGIRVDRWFKRHYPSLALSHLAKICRKGEVRVDGKRVETSTRLEAGIWS